ncbi:MAG: hypothetical protein WCX73_01740 [Candidatus Pacearchaeota archaeon]|jgi:hypothetical protein
MKQTKNLMKQIGIVNEFTEAVENITVGAFHPHLNPLMFSEAHLITYQILRKEIKNEKISLNLSHYDALVAKATSKLNYTPLYISEINQPPRVITSAA